MRRKRILALPASRVEIPRAVVVHQGIGRASFGADHRDTVPFARDEGEHLLFDNEADARSRNLPPRRRTRGPPCRLVRGCSKELVRFACMAAKKARAGVIGGGQRSADPAPGRTPAINDTHESATRRTQQIEQSFPSS